MKSKTEQDFFSHHILVIWMSTVFLGSVVFGISFLLLQNIGNPLYVFLPSVLAVFFSLICGLPTLLLLLCYVRFWDKPQHSIKTRLLRLHLFHLICAGITLLVLYLLDWRREWWVIGLSCYLPVASLLWAVRSWRLIRNYSEAVEPA